MAVPTNLSRNIESFMLKELRKEPTHIREPQKPFRSLLRLDGATVELCLCSDRRLHHRLLSLTPALHPNHSWSLNSCPLYPVFRFHTLLRLSEKAINRFSNAFLSKLVAFYSPSPLFDSSQYGNGLEQSAPVSRSTDLMRR
ncbi:uncharacterized protein YALI1_E12027g [Yarrowia lipolytica]|uniref:Uncharacterized protein n=1 Tax=Yarrowia lipolytica TaxID=4952 RepID=A0A1D8NHT5_YARLL|nr:hypothetical protein YALI1_E12027g [Yarrowia lipolytica]